MSVHSIAVDLGLKIIPAMNKVGLPLASLTDLS